MSAQGVTQPLNVPIGPRLYRLVANWWYLWIHDGQVHRLAIRRGFEYDGASVPRLAWSLSGLRPDGLIRAAALPHDYLYRYKGRLPGCEHTVWCEGLGWLRVAGCWSRRDADRLFGRIMREAGVRKFQRRIAYRFVRALGWLSWLEW